MAFISILVLLLILTVIISLHEAGHFFMAKKFGVYGKEFAIGMGPKLWQKQTAETTYSIRAIPMGGYVQMIGEEGELFTIKKGDDVWLKFNDAQQISEIFYKKPEDAAEDAVVAARIVAFARAKQPMKLTYLTQEGQQTAETTALVTCYDVDNQAVDLVANNRQFNYLAPLKKIAILVAGVCMNFVLAFVVVFVATWIAGVNVEPVIATDNTNDVVNRFTPNDRILRINEHAFSDAEDVRNYALQNGGKTVNVTVDRDGKEVVLRRTIQQVTGQHLTKDGVQSFTYGIFGITYNRNHTNLLKILQFTFASFASFFEYVYFSLVGMFTGKISFTNLKGFIGTAQQTNMVVNTAVSNFSFMDVLAIILNFTAFLSINIGMINILPFPALDGGRIVFVLYELIFRKKPNPKFETYFNAFGFILLIALFLGVTFFDIMRLFKG